MIKQFEQLPDGSLYAKTHDKQGNFNVYVVPPDIFRIHDAIVHFGTRVAYKEKGDVYRTIDGNRDHRGKEYNALPTFDAPEPTGETFGDHPILTCESFTIVNYPVTCGKCRSSIPGLRRASRDGSGAISRLQRFEAFHKGVTVDGKTYLCHVCGSGAHSTSAATPVKGSTPAAKSAEITGAGGLIFSQVGSDFYRKDIKITRDGKHGYVIAPVECAACKGEILLKSRVWFKDGKPVSVAAGVPVDCEAAPVRKGSRAWQHKTCPSIQPDAPHEPLEPSTPIEAPLLCPEAETPPTGDPSASEGQKQNDSHPLAHEPAHNPTAAADLLADLERVAVDQAFNDDFVRGVTWAVLRLLKGGMR